MLEPTSRLRRALLLAMDTVLVVVAAMVIWNATNGRRAQASPTARVPLIAIGARINLPDVELFNVNVVARLRTTCPACNESLTFYRALSDRIREHADARLIVISSELPEVMSKWLTESGIHPHTLTRVEDPTTLGLLEIPTLLIVDRDAKVTDIMVRNVSEQLQHAFLRRLAGEGIPINNANYADELTKRHFDRVAESKHAVLIDIRAREEFNANMSGGARNIPLDELAIRLPLEVQGSHRSIAIDCRNENTMRCRTAALAIKSLGYQDVVIVFP